MSDLSAEVQRLREREAALVAIAREALDEWAYCAQYKSDFLRAKHGDDERVAELRGLLGDAP